MAVKLAIHKKAVNMLFNRKPKISFCITCRDRFWQICKTLPQNLKDNYKDRKNVEFILVDFASADGLKDWVLGNFAEELRSGYLKYYYTEEMPVWHMSVAKNTVHMLANNEVVVNLDCDNFTGYRGGEYVRGFMWRYGYKRVVLHMEKAIGTAGRIVVSKENFLRAGGYDEDLGFYGHEDRDMVKRLKGLGLVYLARGKDPYVEVIPNARGLGMPSELDIKEQMEMNRRLSEENIARKRFVANPGKDMIGVRAVRMYGK